jgi:hypothetical protein
MKLDSLKLANAITAAMRDSLDWVESRKAEGHITPNSLKSSMFCTQIGTNLDRFYSGEGVTKRQIIVNGDGERTAGEWLLDIAWTEGWVSKTSKVKKPRPGTIRCAVECESSTAGREFFKDFAKLVNIKSQTKIFLGGLNQVTPAAAERYRADRVEEAGELVRDIEGNNSLTDWYIGFWPSPAGTLNTSLWDRLGEYPHLTKGYVYCYDPVGYRFVECTAGG